MFSTFKRFALVVGLASICFAATASAQTKITVAYVPVADFLPAFVAKEKGFFERNGLEVTLKPIIVASNIPPAMVAGDVQIGLGTGPNMMMANENGLDLVSIYGITRDTTENPISSLIVRKSSGIKEAKDFIGKKVAVPGLNSGLDIFTREAEGRQPGSSDLRRTADAATRRCAQSRNGRCDNCHRTVSREYSARPRVVAHRKCSVGAAPGHDDGVLAGVA
jgi:ABC-type nitrate/sulfonate/bicarbonate transport system substrate-binding protein